MGEKRRTSDLYQEMQKMARLLLPDWKQSEKGQFGDALLHCAAYMGGQVTERIRKIPDRDAAEFYNRLDLSAGEIKAAEVPLVFSLAEKREQPVYMPERIQAIAKAEPDDVMFETKQALNLVPGAVDFIAGG